jgi:Ca-activated chloride channel family protein
MTFLWPSLLWCLVAVPLLIALYVWLMRRKKKVAVRYASLSMVRDAMGPGQRIRRHIPPVLFLLALTLMILGIARPAAVITLPSQRDTVVLAMDVSRSMLAEDVKPNRMVAAQQAARAFVNAQPRTTRIALVAFAATAQLVQPPTDNKEDLLAAIDRFELQRGTAIGSGLIVSLATLFPDAGITIDSVGNGAAPGVAGRRDSGQSLDRKRDADTAERPAFVPVPPGSYSNAAVILLTDGQTTTGIDPLEAAKVAADRGVRVFTVGVGTKDGEILRTEGWAMRVRLDEETLKTIASTTRGEYYYAGTATDLTQIYETLNSRLVMEKKETEITALFAAAAAVLAAASALLSLLWFSRIL